MSLTTHDSPQWDGATPALSVLVPFYRDDATALLRALDGLHTNEAVELLIYDDGTGDAALTDAVKATIAQCQKPARFLSNAQNKGRAAARNALQDAARAKWVLFLDADMQPVSETFLQAYLDVIAVDAADIVFGGFEVEDRSADKDRDLHRALSHVSDCLSLEERIAGGPQYVASSNLCVRKSVLREEPFDTGFSGWGWEDSEWAARVAKRYSLRHIDNPAIHLGLETTETLLSRFSTSGGNYLRFTQAHPELAQSLALYRISRKLGRLPGQTALRPILRGIVRSHIAPMTLRLNALKLWRASHYAEALS
jgi:glycosyltransferase involved in cell wall biosynthesis